MKNSRQKGASFERTIAHKICEYGYVSRRGQQYSGANGDADVVGLPGIHIECKAVEKLNIYDALRQSENDARPGEIPIVVHKKNYKPIVVTMHFEDWMKFYQRYINGESKEEMCVDELHE